MAYHRRAGAFLRLPTPPTPYYLFRRLVRENAENQLDMFKGGNFKTS